MATYVDLPLFKSSIKITAADRDTLMTQALEAASRAVDAHTGRRDNAFTLDDDPSVRTYNPASRITPDGLLLVDEIGSATGLAVAVGTSAAWVPVTDHETSPDNALADGQPITGLLRTLTGWPLIGAERVRVTARWGWPTVPSVVVQATLIQATRFYRRKDNPEGTAGGGEWGTIRLSRVDPDVAALLAHLTLPGFA